MNKLYSLLLALMYFGNTYSQATTVMFEDFQGTFPTGWSLINNDGLLPETSVAFINDAWVVTEDLDNVGSGDSVLTSTSWYDPSGTSDDWLISPAITLGSFGNKLSFKAKSYDGSYPDGFQVFASTHNLIDSFFQQDTLLDISAQAPIWTRYYVSLDSFGLADQTIYLAFRNNSSDQYLLSLDSIYVGIEHPLNLATAEPFVSAILFPNPATDKIQIEIDANILKVEIFSIEGRIIGTYTSNTIDISQISPGQYLMIIQSNKGQAVRKFEKH